MDSKFRSSRYSDNLRDFINKDLRIERDEKYYYFRSKREPLLFAQYQYSEEFSTILLFQICDSIFFMILNWPNDETV